MNWIFGTTYLPKKIFYNLALISDYLILTIKNQNLATLIYLPGIRATGPSVSQFEDWNTTSLPTSFKHIAFTIGKSILTEHLYSSCFYLLCFYMTNLLLFLHIALGKSCENMGGFVRIRMLLVKVFHPIMHRVGYIFILLWPNEQSELNNGKTKLALISYQFDFRCVNKMSVTSTTIVFSYFF